MEQKTKIFENKTSTPFSLKDLKEHITFRFPFLNQDIPGSFPFLNK